MKTAVVTHIRYQGYLNLEYEKDYSFLIDNHKAIIILLDTTKGLRITDTNNFHTDDNGKTLLAKPIDELKKGYTVKASPVFDQPEEDAEESFIQMSVGYEADRDLFIIEHYYTQFQIFVEFDDFRQEIFTNNETRIIYNKIVFKALNHFIAKYNVVHNLTALFNFDYDPTSGETTNINNTSFILKQASFLIEDDWQLEDYVRANFTYPVTPTLTVLERAGNCGWKGAQKNVIAETTRRFDAEVRKPLTAEEGFLSSALQEKQKFNYRYAFLEAFLAVEVTVEKFLSARNQGQNKQDNSINYQINTQIPKLLARGDKKYARLLAEINKIRKIRNNIVHQGLFVSETEVAEAIDRITEYVNYLSSIPI